MQCDERPVIYGSTSDTSAIIPEFSVSSTFSPIVSQKFVDKEVFKNVIVPKNVPIFEAKKNNTDIATAVAPFDVGSVDNVKLFFIPEIIVQVENQVIGCDKRGKLHSKKFCFLAHFQFSSLTGNLFGL